MVQLSHPYITTGKTIALTIWTFVGKVMSLSINMLSTFVIAFLPLDIKNIFNQYDRQNQYFFIFNSTFSYIEI